MGDLFTQHSNDTDSWKFYGRSDDLLTFSTAENFHTAEAERHMAHILGVADFMFVGTKKPNAALIVKLAKNVDV